MLTQDFTDLIVDESAPPPTWKKDQLLRGYTHLHVRSDPGRGGNMRSSDDAGETTKAVTA
jgi:hypothetical protein